MIPAGSENTSFRFVPRYGVKRYPCGKVELRYRGGWWLPQAKAGEEAVMDDTPKMPVQDGRRKNMMALLNHLLEKKEPLWQPRVVPRVSKISESMKSRGDFQGNIIPWAISEEDKLHAKSYASLMTNMLLETKTTQYHVYFADGSLRSRNGRAAAGIVWRKPSPSDWGGKGLYFSVKTPNRNLVELYAIDCALEIATKEILETKARSRKTHEVLIFSDSQVALSGIMNFKSQRSPSAKQEKEQYRLLQSVMERSEALKSQGVNLELHWVPGHKAVPGNTLADKLAGATAKSKIDGRGRKEES